MARTVRKRKQKPWAGVPKPVSKPKQVSESKKATSTPKVQASKSKQTGKSKKKSGFRGKLGGGRKGNPLDRGAFTRQQKHKEKLNSCIRAGYAALPGGSSAHATGSAEKLAVREGCRSKGRRG